MLDERVTKRLHVSGLTPAITTAELSTRLGSFGKVKALDGFGLLDGVGRPRKFGYVTIETTKSQLTRCMNTLSGVTWKGTKLRIGEAKPDFNDRISREVLQKGDVPSAPKKRRIARATHAEDMSLVTPENIQARGGWKVTELGRIIRPIRMRPDHPLPDPLSRVASTKKKSGIAKKKRVRPPPVRARRRTIDPSKWGSIHLKGVFLESGLPLASQVHSRDVATSANSPSSDESEDEEFEEEHLENLREPRTVVGGLQQPARSSHPLLQLAKPARTSPATDLREESKATLRLLHSFFGDRDDDWGGAESISDVDIANPKELDRAEAGNIEAVAHQQTDDVAMQGIMVDVGSSPVGGPTPAPPPTALLPSRDAAQKTKLKDLFAPREEEAEFSLLNHLNLGDGMDLDEDILGFEVGPASAVPNPAPIAPVLLIATTPSFSPSAQRHQVTQLHHTLDVSQPFFFPLALEDRGAQRSKVRDPYDTAKAKGWDWRSFCRTDTDEEIKKRWEGTRGELTQDWKRRHREAVKSRRRRGGFGGDEE